MAKATQTNKTAAVAKPVQAAKPAHQPGAAVFTALTAHAAAQQSAPAPQGLVPLLLAASSAAPAVLTPAVLAAAQAASLVQAAQPAQAATPAHAATQAAYGRAVAHGQGTYKPGSGGAQLWAIAASLTAQGVAKPNGAALLAGLPKGVKGALQTSANGVPCYWRNGTMHPCPAASAGAVASHYAKYHGTLRVKGAVTAPTAQAVTAPTPQAVALQVQGFNSLAAAGFVMG